MSTTEADKKLTPRQAEILGFIREYQREEGMPPTQSEIAERFGLKGLFGVRQHLKLIEKKRCLRLIHGKARGIRLTRSFTPEQNEICEIPVVGHIAAGSPVLAVDDIQECLKIEQGLFHGRNLFALRVKGDSMINAGIIENDIAIINKQPLVDNGDIAAVILDDEATLKRVMLGQEGRVRLKAENDHFQDIVITSETDQQFRILGRFVGLIRQGPIKSYNLNGLS